MSDNRIQIELLGRPECHLCDEAFEVLLSLQEELGFRVVKVDISRSLEYLRLYRNDIPVALIEGRELFRHRVTASGLRELLASEAAPQTDEVRETSNVHIPHLLFCANVTPMAIYTRTGDGGETSLYSGERVNKSSLRVEAYGTLDELNSVLGAALAFSQGETISQYLAGLQNQLFEAGADLATLTTVKRGVRRIQASDWQLLESWIDTLQEDLPPLKHFILPGGNSGASMLHLARSVCRRGERLICRLDQESGEVNPDLLIYVNRLSDLLFVMARYENISTGVEEVIWKPR